MSQLANFPLSTEGFEPPPTTLAHRFTTGPVPQTGVPVGTGTRNRCRGYGTVAIRLAGAERNRREPEALAHRRFSRNPLAEHHYMKVQMFVHGEAVASANQPAYGKGTFAVVVGISKYRGPQASQLDFANSDARMIYKYLVDPKGANIPEKNIQLLIDEDATVSAIRDAFDHIKSLRPETVVVFIAAHGLEAGNEAYVIANDTNPQAPVATGLPMREINGDLTSELAGARDRYL